MEYNFYKILGVQTTAGTSEIKRTYRQLAFKFHPDRNEDVKAKEYFQLLTEAYSILSDPEKRKIYDKKNNFNQTFEESYQAHSRARRSRRSSVNMETIKPPARESMPPKYVRYVLFSTGLIFGLFMVVFPIIQTIEYTFSPTLFFIFLGFILTVDSIAGLTGYRTMIFYELFRVMRNR